MTVVCARELAILRAFRTPGGVQRALESMPYHHAMTVWSPRLVPRHWTAHCLEASIFAPTALTVLGFRPLIVDLEAVHDDDHVVAVYRTRRHWGAM